MKETAERVNLRDRCGQIHEGLNEVHRFVDELTGPEAPEAPTDNITSPGSQEGQGSLDELEDMLRRIAGKVQILALRLEDLVKQV